MMGHLTGTIEDFNPRTGRQPAFLITIDTEGDNAWSRPAQITTENVAFLSRFQRLCEEYCLKPTYLTTWEIADSRRFVEMALDVQRRGTGEIGMHLHISDHTVQDHLKAIFDKTDVRSRRELVVAILQEHYLPRAIAGHAVGRSGCFER